MGRYTASYTSGDMPQAGRWKAPPSVASEELARNSCRSGKSGSEYLRPSESSGRVNGSPDWMDRIRLVSGR